MVMCKPLALLTALPLPTTPHYSTAALKRVVHRLEKANIIVCDIRRDEVVIRLEPLKKEVASPATQFVQRDQVVVAVGSFVTIAAGFYALAPWLA